MDAEAEWSAVWNEALATTLFTFIGGGTVAVTGNVAFEELLPPRLAVISLAQGLVYTILLYLTFLVTEGGVGFMNPSLTFAVAISNHTHRRYSWKGSAVWRAIYYVLAQLLGSILGSILILATVPNSHTGKAKLGAPMLGYGSTAWSAAAFELMGTFFLTWVALGNIARRGLQSKIVTAPMALGFAYVSAQLFAFPFTGACFNPARAIGPALITLDFTDILVHTLAPMTGAFLGAMLYVLVFTNKDSLFGLESKKDK